MGKSIVFKVSESKLNNKIINKLLPEKKVKINVKDKIVIIDGEFFEIDSINNISTDGNYYIEMVNANLACANTTNSNIKIYDGLIVKLYLCEKKKKINVKLFNVGKYNEEVAFTYITKYYNQLYKNAVKFSEKIKKKNKTNLDTDVNSYGYTYSRIKSIFDEADNNSNKSYYRYHVSGSLRISNLKNSIDNIYNNFKNLIKHYNDKLLSSNNFNGDEEKLIRIAESEFDFRHMICENSWTNEDKLSNLLYYMTYINMHSLNGIIFDDRIIEYKNNDEDEKWKRLRGFVSEKKRKGEIKKYNYEDEGEYIGALGIYYYIESEQEAEAFRDAFDIKDNIGIGKYVVIGPKNIEKFVNEYIDTYFGKKFFKPTKEDYKMIKAGNYNVKNFNVNDMYALQELLNREITKLVFYHELGHMAFSNNSQAGFMIESNESAANWYASIGLNVVEKYRQYLKTRLQPQAYRNYFTNVSLLPSGKLLSQNDKIDDIVDTYNIVHSNFNIKNVIKFKNDAAKEYYDKVMGMINDMY